MYLSITQTSFTYTRIDSVAELQHGVEDWLKLVEDRRKAEENLPANKTGSFLYDRLIKAH